MSQTSRQSSTKTKSRSSLPFVWVIISQLKKEDDVMSVMGIWTRLEAGEMALKTCRGERLVLFAVPLVGRLGNKILDYLSESAKVRSWAKRTTTKYFDIQAGVLLSIRNFSTSEGSILVKGPEGTMPDYILPQVASIDRAWS